MSKIILGLAVVALLQVGCAKKEEPSAPPPAEEKMGAPAPAAPSTEAVPDTPGTESSGQDSGAAAQ